MLIPLFGLQMILTVHRPRSSTKTAEQLHEFVFMLTVGSQVRQLTRQLLMADFTPSAQFTMSVL